MSIGEAQLFCVRQSHFQHKELFGVTDGKAVGTLIEQKFQKHLHDKYEVTIGSSASGVDLLSDDITGLSYKNRFSQIQPFSVRIQHSKFNFEYV